MIRCAKIPFPCKGNVVEAHIFQKDCMCGACSQCAKFEESEECVLQCPTLFDQGRRYKWKEFEDCILENGNSIRELRTQEGSFDVFRKKFLEKLVKYKIHYFKYR